MTEDPATTAVLQLPWSVFAAAQDAALLYEDGLDGCRVTQANASFWSISRYAPTDVIGRGIDHLFARELDTDEFRRLWASLGAEPARSEGVLRSCDGVWVPIEIELIPLASDGPRRCLVILRDLSDRDRIRADVALANERLRLASDVGRIGTWEWRPRNGVLVWNHWLRVTLGVGDDVVPSHELWTSLQHPDDRPGSGQNAQLLISGVQDEIEAEYRVQRADGSIRYVLTRTRVSERDQAGNATVLMGVLLDITELRQATAEREALLAAEKRARRAAERANEKLARLAASDALTGLSNRHELQRWITTALSQRDEVSVMFFDIDAFKPINDSYGHSMGDHVLIELAERLRRAVRIGDLVARFGGDEFIVATKAGPVEATRLARRLLDDIRIPISVGGLSVTVTSSVGLSFSDADCPREADMLLSEADLALYHAKSLGPDRAVWFDPLYRAQVRAPADRNGVAS